LFKNKKCSNIKNVQILNMFKFKKCSNFKNVQVLKLFKKIRQEKERKKEKEIKNQK
jgi:hypothetical protein